MRACCRRPKTKSPNRARTPEGSFVNNLVNEMRRRAEAALRARQLRPSPVMYSGPNRRQQVLNNLRMRSEMNRLARMIASANLLHHGHAKFLARRTPKPRRRG